jgi:uncharacterized membrane protein YqjE
MMSFRSSREIAMPHDDLPPSGVFESLRKLCDTGLAILQNRLELFGVEVEEQKARLLRVLFLGAVVVLLANTALFLVTATIIMLVGEDARVVVLVGLSLLYASAAGGIYFLLRRELRSAPLPFNDTVSELKKDRQWLDSQKQK